MHPRHLPILLPLFATPAWANHGTPVDAAPQEILVDSHYDNSVGSSDAASAGSVRRALIETRGAQRPGEVLEFVPGVIVTQHSGDGKANQYFLRGFNLDHGTDFATRLAGMPLNLPSHGHGQGYTDLNPLIPELVERIEYRKGPYDARVGDFAAAGSADIRLLSRVARPFGQLTLGGNGYRRGLAGGSASLSTDGGDAGAGDLVALGAVEIMTYDGPWTVPQGLDKRNAVASLTGGTRGNGWHVMAMGYRARWTATDQVPERLLQPGSGFGRFDSLDPSAGGSSSRTSLSGDWHVDAAGGRTTLAAYAVRYRLDLNSNFTYALERPADGDQFKQTDARRIIGLDLTRAFNHDLGPWPASTTLGLQLRHDRVRNGLFDSVARRVTGVVREDRIDLLQTGLWAQTAIELSTDWRAVAGLRADAVDARVEALTLPANGGRARDLLASPKLTLAWTAAPRTEVFANLGRGLHSNDARGMTATQDPRSGEPVERVAPLVPVTGGELGLRTEGRGWQVSAAWWALRSASELVYVGDAGRTEASLGSRRRGVELSARWQPRPWLLLDADLAFSRGRLDDGSRIPNAVDRVASLAATLRRVEGWTASLHWRHLGPGALTEDGTVRSRASSTLNLRATRALSPTASVTLDAYNLLDRTVNDIQYFYASRLPGESGPVDDRHVHPAEPRTLRLTLQVAW